MSVKYLHGRNREQRFKPKSAIAIQFSSAHKAQCWAMKARRRNSTGDADNKKQFSRRLHSMPGSQSIQSASTIVPITKPENAAPDPKPAHQQERVQGAHRLPDRPEYWMHRYARLNDDVDL